MTSCFIYREAPLRRVKATPHWSMNMVENENVHLASG